MLTKRLCKQQHSKHKIGSNINTGIYFTLCVCMSRLDKMSTCDTSCFRNNCTKEAVLTTLPGVYIYADRGRFSMSSKPAAEPLFQVYYVIEWRRRTV